MTVANIDTLLTNTPVFSGLKTGTRYEIYQNVVTFMNEITGYPKGYGRKLMDGEKEYPVEYVYTAVRNDYKNDMVFGVTGSASVDWSGLVRVLKCRTNTEELFKSFSDAQLMTLVNINLQRVASKINGE